MTRQTTPTNILDALAPAAVVDGATTITAATDSAALPWLRRCGKVASRKASAIAGRQVVVEFVGVGE